MSMVQRDPADLNEPFCYYQSISDYDHDFRSTFPGLQHQRATVWGCKPYLITVTEASDVEAAKLIIWRKIPFTSDIDVDADEGIVLNRNDPMRYVWASLYETVEAGDEDSIMDLYALAWGLHQSAEEIEQLLMDEDVHETFIADLGTDAEPTEVVA